MTKKIKDPLNKIKATRLIRKTIEKEKYKIALIKRLKPSFLYNFYYKQLVFLKDKNMSFGKAKIYTVAEIIKFGKLHITIYPLASISYDVFDMEDGTVCEPDLKFRGDPNSLSYTNIINMNHIISVDEYSPENIPLLLGWEHTGHVARWLERL